MARKSKIAKKKRRKRYRDQFRFVVLRLVGKNLDSDKVTESLGLEPAFAQPAASLKREFKKVFSSPYGHWTLESRLRRNATLQNQLKDILEQIRPKKAALRRILKGDVDADINIAVEPDARLAVAAYTFPAEDISEFASLGIDVRFSIHIPICEDDP